MTLNTRNRLLMAMNLIASVIFVIYLVGIVLFIVKGGEDTVPELYRNFQLSSTSFLFRNSIVASMICLLIFPLYVAAFGLYIYFSFEKTKSPEIVYFSIFMVGCILQSAGLLIAIFGIWTNITKFLIWIGRIMLTGKIISIIAFLMTTIFIGTENAEDRTGSVDRNLVITLALALFVSAYIPFNTTKITTSLWIQTGFDIELTILLLLIMIISLIVFAIYQAQKKIPFFKGPVLYLFLLYFGFSTLSMLDCYFFLILGTICFFIGTYFYLSFLRKKYLWN